MSILSFEWGPRSACAELSEGAELDRLKGRSLLIGRFEKLCRWRVTPSVRWYQPSAKGLFFPLPTNIQQKKKKKHKKKVKWIRIDDIHLSFDIGRGRCVCQCVRFSEFFVDFWIVFFCFFLFFFLTKRTISTTPISALCPRWTPKWPLTVWMCSTDISLTWPNRSFRARRRRRPTPRASTIV